ncbi:MAG: rRNA maturation RNase YbeY [Candidatus Daviesbacteria bacterium]|nr:rRNA maturation RNase YbeY [Candidatus Daviesbacteria bacterium]
MINIIVSSDPRYRINKAAIRAAVLTALQRHHILGKIELGVNIVGDRKMHELNKRYRGIDSTTDILSFALEESTPSNLQHIPRVGFVAAPDSWLRLGDILISYPQAIEDAGLDGISVDEEIRNLVEHGVNHLLGVHHSS